MRLSIRSTKRISGPAALVVAALALGMAAGCGSGERPGPQAPAGGGASGAPATPAPAADTSPSPAPGGAPGSLRGTVLLAGERPAPPAVDVNTDVQFCGGKVAADPVVVGAGGELANVVVTIAGVKGASVTPSELTIANKHCNFEPRVAAATVGSTLFVTNEDPVNHTTHARQANRDFFNVPVSPGAQPIKRPLRRAGTVAINCDIHKWMIGWIIVHENDLHAVSGADGRFAIDGVPPGTYTVTAWHESLGTLEKQVTIEAGKEAELALSFGQ